MKSFTFLPLLVASLTSAHPVRRQNAPMPNIDATVLQFALTLEHLENSFYKGALEKLSEQDFQQAGYSTTYYNNLKYIASDEQNHVETLSTALMAANQTPVAACTYSFPYTDVTSFITLSSVLEGVGTSAYLGGAALITSKAYLTVAGSILVTEALHTSMQREAIGEVPMANAYGTPLSPNPVYTLAASFITSCPANNTALPFMSFPSLMVMTPDNKGWGEWNHGKASTYTANYEATFMANATVPAGSFATFVSGLTTMSVPIDSTNGTMVTAKIPSGVSGQTYAFITKDNVTTLTDASVLFGPVVVEVQPPAPMIDFSEV